MSGDYSQLRYYREHREEINAAKREYRKKHPYTVRAKNNEYRHKNIEATRACNNRFAKKRMATYKPIGKFSTPELIAELERRKAKPDDGEKGER